MLQEPAVTDPQLLQHLPPSRVDAEIAGEGARATHELSYK
jgi:hypothetical protein